MPEPLLAGAAEAVITPPVGIPLLGTLQASTGVHDDLFVRALVITTGSRRLAIVCLDLVGLDFALADDLRAAIQHRTGIPTVLLACSHTHSAPFTIPWSVRGAAWLSRKGAPWRTALISTVVDTVAHAGATAVRALLRAGRAPAQVGRNRRHPTPGGMVMQPYDEGQIVPWTDVLRVDDASGGPIAVLFTHAAHAVAVHSASTLISADYPGYAVDQVRRHFRRGCIALFAQACGADINSDPLAAGFEEAERMGRGLGDAAIAAAEAAEPVAASAFRIRRAAVALPFSDPPPLAACEAAMAEAEAAARLARDEQGADTSAAYWAEDTMLCLKELAEQCRRGVRPPLRFEIQLVATGREWGLLAMTHEVFAEYQLYIDRIAPFRHTMVMAYTNGIESYIPTDAALAEGGYESSGFPSLGGSALRYHHRLRLKPGAESLIKQALAALMKQVDAP